MKMDWAEDLKMTLKKTVKKGRRAEQTLSTSTNLSSESPSTPEQETTGLDSALLEDFSSSLDLKTVPMKLKKVGGWGDEATRSAGSSGKNNRNKSNQSEIDRFNSISNALSDDDIPVIPDMDDIPDESHFDDIHNAQAIAVNRVATYKELNSELLKYSAFASSENIDLSKLMKCIQTENVLIESDTPLTSEQLFNEVATYVHACQMKIPEKTPEFIN